MTIYLKSIHDNRPAENLLLAGMYITGQDKLTLVSVWHGETWTFRKSRLFRIQLCFGLKLNSPLGLDLRSLMYSFLKDVALEFTSKTEIRNAHG